jgi:arylsulfatase B
MFQPGADQAEAEDRMDSDPQRAVELFQMLGRWESSLATVPLWGSSPFWIGQSAKHYDTWPVRPEPR